LCIAIELHDKYVLGDYEVPDEMAKQRSRNLKNLKSDILTYFLSVSTEPALSSEVTDTSTKKKC
jgi:hypothetical protein